MSFATIDLVLVPWAQERGFKLVTEYKGYAIRGLVAYDHQTGEMSGRLGIGEPDEHGRLIVEHWSPATGHKTREISLPELRTTLSDMWDQ